MTPPYENHLKVCPNIDLKRTLSYLICITFVIEISTTNHSLTTILCAQ
ncbi:hypothetical protein BLOT_012009, partial [Blomia tropicalis]